MDEEEFLKQRVRLIRNLAAKADPFIKRRLMDLANNYEARIVRPFLATETLMANSASGTEHGPRSS
jgi:hypothetical protein